MSKVINQIFIIPMLGMLLFVPIRSVFAKACQNPVRCGSMYYYCENQLWTDCTKVNPPVTGYILCGQGNTDDPYYIVESAAEGGQCPSNGGSSGNNSGGTGGGNASNGNGQSNSEYCEENDTPQVCFGKYQRSNSSGTLMCWNTSLYNVGGVCGCSFGHFQIVGLKTGTTDSIKCTGGMELNVSQTTIDTMIGDFANKSKPCEGIETTVGGHIIGEIGTATGIKITKADELCVCKQGYDYFSESSGCACRDSNNRRYVDGACKCVAAGANLDKNASYGKCTCGAGYEASVSTTGVLTCTKCSQAYYKTSAGNTLCTSCGDGWGAKLVSGSSDVYVNGATSKSAACTQCGNGTYRGTNGKAIPVCMDCKTLTTGQRYTKSAANLIENGSSVCYVTLAAGEVVLNSSKDPVTCPANNFCEGGKDIYYGTSGGNIGCASGEGAMLKYSLSAAGATSRANCYLNTTAGKWVGLENADQDECPAGYYCAGGTKVYYGETGGATACPAGTYRSSTGATKKDDCAKCAVGSYSSAGSSSCTACPAGTKTSDTGSTSISACSVSCHQEPQKSYIATYKDVSWSGNNTVTNLCAIDTCNPISKGTGVASAKIELNGGKCTPVVSCSGGYHTPKPTASENLTTATCTGCKAGYYCIGGEENPCAENTYSDATQSSCSNCSDKTQKKYPQSHGTTGAKGKETNLADSIKKCYVILAAGKYVSAETSGLVDCSPGQYCPGCVKDDLKIDGWHNFVTKGNDNTTCGTNTEMYYNVSTGGNFSCPAGTYRDTVGGTKPSDCTKCKAGATSLADRTAHTACLLTNETRFCDNSGQCFTLSFLDGREVKQQTK